MWLTASKNYVLILKVCWLIDRQTDSLTDWQTGYRHKAQYIAIELSWGRLVSCCSSWLINLILLIDVNSIFEQL